MLLFPSADASSQSRGVLPNLQEDLGEAKDSEGYWLRQKGLRIWCDPRFHYRPALGWEPTQMSMEDALLGWFRLAVPHFHPSCGVLTCTFVLFFSSYWATEHDYERTISSIKYGGLIQRDQTYRVPERALKLERYRNKKGRESFYTPAEKAMKKLLVGQTETELAEV